MRDSITGKILIDNGKEDVVHRFTSLVAMRSFLTTYMTEHKAVYFIGEAIGLNGKPASRTMGKDKDGITIIVMVKW